VMECNLTGERRGGPGRMSAQFRVVKNCGKLCLWDCISGRPGEYVLVLA
jgi:hypothetical protein